jgi:hypothetical protein
MAKQRVVVNGTEYNLIIPHGQEITLSSDKHAATMTTTLHELQTQYGVKTAYFVRLALNEWRRR